MPPLLPPSSPLARWAGRPRAAVTRLVASYEAQLHSRPFMTQAATSGLLWGAGDCVAQRFEAKRFEVKRVGVNAIYGGAFIGPLGHVWLEWLEAARLRAGLGRTASVLAKVAADTAVFGPIHVLGYLAVPGLACGESADVVAARTRALFCPTLLAESVAWAGVQVRTRMCCWANLS